MGDHQGIPRVVRSFFSGAPVGYNTGDVRCLLDAPEEIWLPREANRARAFRIQCFTVANMAVLIIVTAVECRAANFSPFMISSYLGLLCVENPKIVGNEAWIQRGDQKASPMFHVHYLHNL